MTCNEDSTNNETKIEVLEELIDELNHFDRIGLDADSAVSPYEVAQWLQSKVEDERASFNQISESVLREKTEDSKTVNTVSVNLVNTCQAMPEQYDVFRGERQVGYLRLRHGHFTASYPNHYSERVYEAAVRGSGMFYDHEERTVELKKALTAILKADGVENPEPEFITPKFEEYEESDYDEHFYLEELVAHKAVVEEESRLTYERDLTDLLSDCLKLPLSAKDVLELLQEQGFIDENSHRYYRKPATITEDNVDNEDGGNHESE